MKEKIKPYLITTLKILVFSGFLVLLYAGLVYIYKNISDTLTKNILEYIRVLAWPIVVLLISFTFRNNIAGLIERVEEWEIPGLGKGKAHAVLLQQEVTKTNTIVENNEDKDFIAIVDEKEVEIQALQESKQQLVDKLTRAEIELDFERIYNFIFGNQIELLNQINNLGGEVAFEYTLEHFKKVQQNLLSLKEWSITGYLQFLVNNQLLEYKIVPSSNFGSIAITTKGKAFTAYIAARNYKKYSP